MKISNTVLILVIAMTNIVSTEAKDSDNKCKADCNLNKADCIAKACNEGDLYSSAGDYNSAIIWNCWDSSAKDYNSAIWDCWDEWDECECKCKGGAWEGGACKGGGVRVRDRRALASDEQVLWGPEFDDCWEETYENALYADTKHLFLLAVPKNKDSNCPIIALDNGFSGGEGHGWALAPMLTISDTVPEGVLFLGHTVTFKSFSDAINQLSSSNYAISENEYNIVENNCATLLLDLFTKVGLDYKDLNIATKIENYVGKSLAANDVRVGEIRQAYLERNQGIFHKASFYVWNFAVGDEGMTRALVRSYMNKIVEE